MGRADGLANNFRGRVGDLVFYKVGKRTYIRRHNDNPKKTETALTKHYKSRFGMTSHFCSLISEPIGRWFDAFKDGMLTASNVGTGYNNTNATAGGGTGPLRIVPSLLKVSRGSVAGALDAKAAWKDDEHVLFTWTNNVGQGNAKVIDQVMALLFNLEDEAAFFIIDGATRNQEEQDINVDFPKNHRGKLHAYISFHRYNVRKEVYERSDSQYLGVV